MALKTIKERWDMANVDFKLSPEEAADWWTSEFSKLIEEVVGEIEKKREKKGWIPLGKGEDPWNAGLDTAKQIISKVISGK